MSTFNNVEFHVPSVEERRPLIQREGEPDLAHFAVGGLEDCGNGLFESSLSMIRPIGVRAVATLISLWRRQKGLSSEQVSRAAGIELEELLSAELGERVPEPRVLFFLSGILSVSYEKLLFLAGHTQARDEALSNAAVRFAAQSGPMDSLSPEESAALADFIRIMVD